jgi:hypothetical protein
MMRRYKSNISQRTSALAWIRSAARPTPDAISGDERCHRAA